MLRRRPFLRAPSPLSSFAVQALLFLPVPCPRPLTLRSSRFSGRRRTCYARAACRLPLSVLFSVISFFGLLFAWAPGHLARALLRGSRLRFESWSVSVASLAQPLQPLWIGPRETGPWALQSLSPASPAAPRPLSLPGLSRALVKPLSLSSSPEATPSHRSADGKRRRDRDGPDTRPGQRGANRSQRPQHFDRDGLPQPGIP